jgi:hypothetical protein
MTNAEYIGILYVWSKDRKQGRKNHTVYSWNASEDIAALAREEAVLAGENARLRLELEEGDFEVVRGSMRRRLARTLVQLGMRIDPLVAEEANEE